MSDRVLLTTKSKEQDFKGELCQLKHKISVTTQKQTIPSFQYPSED